MNFPNRWIQLQSVGRWRMMAWCSLLLSASLLVAFAFDRFSQTLTQNAYSLIGERTHATANVIRERILAADERLRLIAFRFEASDGQSALSDAAIKPHFSTVVRVDADINRSDEQPARRGSPDFDGAAVDDLFNERSQIEVTERSAKPSRISLLRKTDVQGLSGFLVAELDTQYLWDGYETSGNKTIACVLGPRLEPAYCPGFQAAEILQRIESGSPPKTNGFLEWDDGNQHWLAGYSTLSFGPRFDTGDWTVVVIQQYSTATATWAAFAALLGLLFFTSLVVARPAEVGGNPISANPGADPASNGIETLEARFSRQRQAMAALSEIDRALLSHVSFDRVIESVLKNAPQVINTDFVAVVLIDRDAPTRTQTIAVRSASPERKLIERASIDLATTRLLISRPDGCSTEDDQVHPFLSPLAGQGAKHFFLWPVFWEGRLAAVFALGLIEHHTMSADELSYARDFSDRLGVAITASALDEELRVQGQFDSTTALPNRRAFRDRLSQEIARARRERRQIALLFIDLDEFKKVNDSIGHVGGDHLLEQASRRLKHCLREEDIVARFGGDEFAILLPAISKGADAAVVAEKLINQLCLPYRLGDQDQFIGASIGISIYPDDGQTVDTMLRNADMAMYRAKGEGGNQYAFFEERMNVQVLDRAALEVDLRNALAQNDLTLFYQPQIDLRSTQIIGAEALIRWTHSKRGVVLPGSFISVAEQSGLIEQIGQFVRKTACAQYSAWESTHIAPPRISVNISSRELRRSDFIARIESVLRETGVRPYCLEFEITESLFVDNSTHIVTALRWLHDRGIRIAIDDFGTGYSSIAYLKRLPFDTLKLDRAFVKDIGSRDGSDAIAAAILGMAKSLGKEVVAEGVETAAQLNFLIEHGCDVAQGYLWSKPLPAREFEALAREWRPATELLRPLEAAETAVD